MHVNVRDILFQGVGYSKAFKIAGERPRLENVRLAEDLEGEFTIGRLEQGLLLRGSASSALELECHRCLRTFTRPSRIKYSQIYSETPDDDEMPITNGIIDLAPLIEQEFVLSLPIKILHAPDCSGLGAVAREYTQANSVKNRARITKRNH
jgi:uncharacterized metal-binding protein YceD (DUF177 family)